MKQLALLLFGCIAGMLAFAQSPQSFQYQSVVRDGSGNVVVNQPVSFQISLISGSATGTVMYVETHSATTNAFGLVILAIGEGTLVSGSFSGIGWGNAAHYIKVEVDITGGTSYVDMGTTQLLSVPYALNSKTSEDAFSGNYSDLNGVPTDVSTFSNDAGYITNPDDADADPANEIQSLSISGNDLTISGANTVTIPQNVYTAGTGIDVTGNVITNTLPDQAIVITGSGATTVTGTYPSFTVSSTDNVNDADSDPTNELQVLSVSNDTLYLSNGGFVSLSGYADTLWHLAGSDIHNANSGKVGIGTTTPPAKLVVQGDSSMSDTVPLFEVKDRSGATVFIVYPDSARFYVGDDGSKTNKGAFAVSGRNTAKQLTNNFLWVTPDSTRIYLDSSNTMGGFAIQSHGHGNNKNFLDVSVDTSQVINPSQSRIVWYPTKSAFLTGKVLIESPDSVGTNSFASGYESKAIGNWSQALGYKSIARGDYSTTIGKNAVANSLNSFAFGDGAKAINQDAYAFGAFTEARGIGSFAFGYVGRDSLGPTGTATKATGNYSFAFGLGSQALAEGAIAFGANDSAISPYSLSLGYKTKASGWYSTAMGYMTKASGSFSTAMGYSTKASGYSSTAIGCSSTASMDFSTAMGLATTASGAGSTAMGDGTTASGYASTAMGDGTTASGFYSTAMGAYTTASVPYSTAIGCLTTASGFYSTAMGANTIASSDYSTAIGFNTKASGWYSTTMGYDTKASGTSSIAMGSYTTASGYLSTAMGENTIASGTYSTSMGNFTKAKPYESFVIGQYNDTTCSATGMTNWVSTDPVFIIGNGSADNSRNNAMTVLKNGNTGIGTPAPSSLFEVNGAIATTIKKVTGATIIDNSAEVWYLTGIASTFTLPAANTCLNRRYILVARGFAITTSIAYTTLAGISSTTVAANSSVEIISDGTNWLQIK